MERATFRGAGVLLVLLLVSLEAPAQGFETGAATAEVDRLYRHVGWVAPSVSAPGSARELVGDIERLLRADLPPGLRARAAELLDELTGSQAHEPASGGSGAAGARAPEPGGRAPGPGARPSGPVEISAHVLLQPEYYLDLPRDSFGSQVRVESPAAELALGLGRRTGEYIYVEGVAQREWKIDSSINIPTPVEGNPLPFENNLVREGYLFAPIGSLDVAFGRQDLFLGPDREDSLYVSNRVPFLDALRATLRLGPLKMTSITSTLENGRAEPDVTIPPNDGTSVYGFGISTILYNVHYFEYTWRRVRLGLGSQVVIARPLNNFHLGDFFPVFSWHNADITPNNMSLVGDVSVAPLRGVELFFQYGYDDISGETFGFGDSAIPTIDAYIGGVRFDHRLGAEQAPRAGSSTRAGGKISGPGPPAQADRTRPVTLGGSLLAGYTHYLWGNFDDSESLSRAIYRLEADGPRRSMPLTSPHGPGALWFRARASLEWRGAPVEWGAARAGLQYRALGRKPGADLYTTPYASSDAIEATARTWNHRVQLEAEYLAEEVFSGAGLGLTVIPEFRWGTDGTAFGLEVSGFFRYHASTVVAE